MSANYFSHWAGHVFSSEESVLRHSESVGCVNRKLDGFSVQQDFRHYTNKANEHRFLMLSADTVERRNGYMCWITDDAFFVRFLHGMLNAHEITDAEFDRIASNLKTIGIEVNYRSAERPSSFLLQSSW